MAIVFFIASVTFVTSARADYGTLSCSEVFHSNSAVASVELQMKRGLRLRQKVTVDIIQDLNSFAVRIGNQSPIHLDGRFLDWKVLNREKRDSVAILSSKELVFLNTAVGVRQKIPLPLIVGPSPRGNLRIDGFISNKPFAAVISDANQLYYFEMWHGDQTVTTFKTTVKSPTVTASGIGNPQLLVFGSSPENGATDFEIFSRNGVSKTKFSLPIQIRYAALNSKGNKLVFLDISGNLHVFDLQTYSHKVKNRFIIRDLEMDGVLGITVFIQKQPDGSLAYNYTVKTLEENYGIADSELQTIE